MFPTPSMGHPTGRQRLTDRQPTDRQRHGNRQTDSDRQRPTEGKHSHCQVSTDRDRQMTDRGRQACQSVSTDRGPTEVRQATDSYRQLPTEPTDRQTRAQPRMGLVIGALIAGLLAASRQSQDSPRLAARHLLGHLRSGPRTSVGRSAHLRPTDRAPTEPQAT